MKIYKVMSGLDINGTIVSNARFADGTKLVASSEEGLKEIY